MTLPNEEAAKPHCYLVKTEKCNIWNRGTDCAAIVATLGVLYYSGVKTNGGPTSQARGAAAVGARGVVLDTVKLEVQ